jgi:hypothetical protein
MEEAARRAAREELEKQWRLAMELRADDLALKRPACGKRGRHGRVAGFREQRDYAEVAGAHAEIQSLEGLLSQIYRPARGSSTCSSKGARPMISCPARAFAP